MVYKVLVEVKILGIWSMMVSVKGMYFKVFFIIMFVFLFDWFIGVDSYDFCGFNGEWKKSGMMSLLVWDVGIDSGMNFMLQNSLIIFLDVIILIIVSSNMEIKENVNILFVKILFML